MTKTNKTNNPHKKTSQIKDGINYEAILREQNSDAVPLEIHVKIVSEGGQLWLGPRGYGEKCAAEGEGFPIGLDIWQGRLRLVIFDDINSEEPQISDLEKAKEGCRRYDNLTIQTHESFERTNYAKRQSKSK